MSDKLFKTSWDNIEYIDVPNLKSKIYKVKNVTVNYDLEEDPIIIDGNVFIISLSNWQYFHLIQECLGQYEFLKQQVDNLRLIFSIDDDSGMDKSTFLNSLSGTFKSLVDIYSPKEEDVLLLYKNKYTFENIYYIYNFFIPCLRNVVPSNGPIHNTEHEDFSHQFELGKCVVKKLNNYISKTQDRKIFISRSKSDRMYISWKEKYYRYKNNEMTSDEAKSFWDYVTRVGEEAFVQNFNNRIHQNNIIIDDFFVSLGYELIYNEDLSLEQQVETYSSATHIASIDGTGCYNAIFAKPNTKVFMITTNRNFYWFFDELIKNVSTTNVYVVPERKKYGMGAVEIEEILSELEKIKDIL